MTDSTLSRFLAGAKASLPVMLGFIGIAVAAGIVEREAGFSILESVLLSSVLYAGASQFAFASLWTLHTDPFTIVMTVFFMNLRHLLFSTAITSCFKKRKWYEYILVGAQLTDETFAFACTKFSHREQIDTAWMVGLNMMPYLTWSLGTFVGCMVFDIFSESKIPTAIFAFALIGMFCSLLVLQIAMRREKVFYALVAIFSVVVCTVASQLGMGSLALPFTIVFCSTVAYFGLAWLRRGSA